MAFTLTEPPENRVHAPLNLPGPGLSLSRYGPYQHVSSSVDGGSSQGSHGRVRADLQRRRHDVGPPRRGCAVAAQPRLRRATGVDLRVEARLGAGVQVGLVVRARAVPTRRAVPT